MNKMIVSVVVVALIAVGAYFLLSGVLRAPTTVYQAPSQQQAAQPTIPEPLAPEQAPVAGESVVTYGDSGFSPSILTIKNGDNVRFENESSKTMWTASGKHPTHKVYPTTGGCIGSTFDACKGTQPGDSWSFKFDVAGNWKYHNHVNPGDTGTIIVE